MGMKRAGGQETNGEERVCCCFFFITLYPLASWSSVQISRKVIKTNDTLTRTHFLQLNRQEINFPICLTFFWMACRKAYWHIWMPSWSVYWVLIWLNLLPLAQFACRSVLQLSGFTAQPPDWLTSARLACVFMHAARSSLPDLECILPRQRLPPSFRFYSAPLVLCAEVLHQVQITRLSPI